jgi:hypothetical protein
LEGTLEALMVSYMLQQYNDGRDPITIMNVLKAVRWAIKAWEIDVKTSIIEQCFHRALKDSIVPSVIVVKDAVHAVEIGLQRLQESAHIRDIMDIN